jgi:hypothetical protein
LLACILINWTFGLLIGRAGVHRARFLAAGVAINVAMPILFKYLGLLLAQLAAVGVPGVPSVDVPRPWGSRSLRFRAGAFIAPCFGEVRQISTSTVNRLSAGDRGTLREFLFHQYRPDDVIFLYHDGAVQRSPGQVAELLGAAPAVASTR